MLEGDHSGRGGRGSAFRSANCFPDSETEGIVVWPLRTNINLALYPKTVFSTFLAPRSELRRRRGRHAGRLVNDFGGT